MSPLTGAERWLASGAGRTRTLPAFSLLAWLNTGRPRSEAIDGLVELIEGSGRLRSRGGGESTVLLVDAAEDEDVAVEAMARLVERSGRDALAARCAAHAKRPVLADRRAGARRWSWRSKRRARSDERKYRVWAAQLAAEQGQLELALSLVSAGAGLRAGVRAAGAVGIGSAAPARARRRSDCAVARDAGRQRRCSTRWASTWPTWSAGTRVSSRLGQSWRHTSLPEEVVQHAFLVARLADTARARR
jgi:hypothetical protein